MFIKSLIIVDHHSNYYHKEVYINTYRTEIEYLLHRRFEFLTFKILAFLNSLKSTPELFVLHFCHNALKSKNKRPDYHRDIFVHLTLIKVRFRKTSREKSRRRLCSPENPWVSLYGYHEVQRSMGGISRSARGVEKLKFDFFSEKNNEVNLVSNPYLWLKNLLSCPLGQRTGVAEKTGGDRTIEIEKIPKNRPFSLENIVLT